MADASRESGPDAEVLKAIQAAFGDDVQQWFDDEQITSATEDIHQAELSTSVPDESDSLEALVGRINDSLHQGSLGDTKVDEQEVSNSANRHVVFEVGGQQFGILLSSVREIDRRGKVTHLPRTPSWLQGVTNLRGQILSVTDLRELLVLSDSHRPVVEKIIVIHSHRHDASTALLVDRVLGIRQLGSKEQSLASLTDQLPEFAVGVCVVDQQTTIIIDADSLIGSNVLQTSLSE